MRLVGSLTLKSVTEYMQGCRACKSLLSGLVFQFQTNRSGI